MDNSECLDLVEKNLGLISLINEESRFPKGTDASLLQKLHNQHKVYINLKLNISFFHKFT